MAIVQQDRSLTRRIKGNEEGAFGCVEETAGSKVKRETNEVGTATQFSWLCARFWQPSLSPWIFSRRRGLSRVEACKGSWGGFTTSETRRSFLTLAPWRSAALLLPRHKLYGVYEYLY